MKERLLRTLDEYRRLFFLALSGILIGILIGLVEAFFGWVIDCMVWIHNLYSPWTWFLMPLGGLVIVWLSRRVLTPSCRGMNSVFDGVFGTEQRVSLRIGIMGMLGTWISQIGGASVGKEGVGVQIGASMADFIHHLMPSVIKKRQDHSLWIIAGMAAGFSGLFQVPFCAAVFALEVIASGTIQLPALIITVFASISARISASLTGWHLEIFQPADLVVNFDDQLGYCVLFGIAFGIAAMLFAFLLKKAKNLMAGWIKNPYIRIFAGGCIMAAAICLFHNGTYANAGLGMVNNALSGQPCTPWDWLAKLIITILCLSVGFLGGEVMPLFSIGASLGSFLAALFGLNPVVGAAVGLCALFGSATGTFLAPVVLGVELFGSDILPGLFIACSVAFAINRTTGIYASQRKICLINGQPRIIYGRHSKDSMEFF